MQRLSSVVSVALQRDAAAGAVASLGGGFLLWWALHDQGMTSTVPGLLGFKLSGEVGVFLHLMASILLGAGFGVISRYRPLGYSSTISGGLLYGLLWWIAGPLTLGALFDGRGPTWSIGEASTVFPSLVGHLLYGGLTGLGFYIMLTLYLHLRPEREPVSVASEAPKTRVVILGGGFGGIATAQRLEQLFTHDPNLEITLVSQSNYLLFTPMLAEVASSSLEAQHISAPVRATCRRTRFHRADVAGIDTSSRVVSMRGGPSLPTEALPYDHLVLALGSIPNYYGLPGLAEHSFALKTLEDATRLRNHVIALLEHAAEEPNEKERARQLTFVVAGGGFAGTEVIAELFDLVRSVLRYYPNIQTDEPRFVLIHSGDRILPELSPELGDYALRKLQQRGIEFQLHSRVAGATSIGVLLDQGRSVPTCTLLATSKSGTHWEPRDQGLDGGLVSSLMALL